MDTKQRAWEVQIRTPRGADAVRIVAGSARDALSAALAGEQVQRIVAGLRPDARCSATCDGLTTAFYPDELGDRLTEAVGAGKDQKDEPATGPEFAWPLPPPSPGSVDELLKALGDALVSVAAKEALKKAIQAAPFPVIDECSIVVESTKTSTNTGPLWEGYVGSFSYRPTLSRLCRMARCSPDEVVSVRRSRGYPGWVLQMQDGRIIQIDDLALAARRG